MKVKRDTEFKPIMVTLETEGEADAIWHLLNVSKHDFDVKTGQAEHMFRGDGSEVYSMWRIFDETYTLPQKIS